MCAAIRHRGPDDAGVHVEGGIGLGMRRLSTIDLAGGRQPIFNEDRSKVIVFNGEIYNYRELRRGLVARGHRFTTQGDTETILHLYEEEGPECVQRLRGMFAFAIWDASAQRLFLARDRFGIKPLYIATAPWGIAFASELKALHAAGLVDRTLDWEALDMYLQLGYIPAPATPFRAVRKLEPAHTAAWHARSGLTTRPYWDLPRNRVEAPGKVDGQVLEWLDEAGRAHLVSDVAVAAFLSGGLDSSAVVASWAVAGDAPPPVPARHRGSGAARAGATGIGRGAAGPRGRAAAGGGSRPMLRSRSTGSSASSGRATRPRPIVSSVTSRGAPIGRGEPCTAPRCAINSTGPRPARGSASCTTPTAPHPAWRRRCTWITRRISRTTSCR